VGRGGNFLSGHRIALLWIAVRDVATDQVEKATGNIGWRAFKPSKSQTGDPDESATKIIVGFCPEVIVRTNEPFDSR
jgi:hypothetical protein